MHYSKIKLDSAGHRVHHKGGEERSQNAGRNIQASAENLGRTSCRPSCGSSGYWVGQIRSLTMGSEV